MHGVCDDGVTDDRKQGRRVYVAEDDAGQYVDSRGQGSG
jgi:hypothetical protein